MKRAFITGAAGFIGGYVAEEFVNRGWRVTALIHKRKSAKIERLGESGHVVSVEGDIRDYESLRAALRAGGEARYDAIVHCAGRASDVGRRSEFRRANLDSVKHLVRLTRELDVGRFVFVSTTDVYGLRDFNGEAEDELALKARPGNPYPEYKIAAEEFLRKEMPRERYCIVRPAQAWGVGDTTLTPRIVAFLKWSPCIVHFGKWRGRNRWPLAHARNVALTIFLAATDPEAAGRAVNVLDDENTTMDEFYRILARVYLPHKKFKTVTFPFWVGQCIGTAVSGISNALNLDKPFMDPSFYALYSVSRNLDFGNRRMKDLFVHAGCSGVTRDAGIRELEMAEGKPA